MNMEMEKSKNSFWTLTNAKTDKNTCGSQLILVGRNTSGV